MDHELVSGSKISPVGLSDGFAGSLLYSPPMQKRRPSARTPDANHCRAYCMEISDDQLPLSYLPFWSGVRRSHWLALTKLPLVTYPLCISSDPSVNNIMMSAANRPLDVSGTVNVVQVPGMVLGSRCWIAQMCTLQCMCKFRIDWMEILDSSGSRMSALYA